MRAAYDYIVIGSGSSGGIVASRLSENPTVRVLLLEAGGRFIKRFVPELEAAPPVHIAEPHSMPSTLQWRLGCVIGKD